MSTKHRIVTITTNDSTKHAWRAFDDCGSCMVKVGTKPARVLMVTAQEMTHAPNPLNHNIRTVARVWISASSPVAAVCVQWGDDDRVLVSHPIVALTDITGDVAAANRRDCKDLSRQHVAIRGELGSHLLRAGLINCIQALTASEPHGQAPSLHAGAKLLDGITQTDPILLMHIYADACGFADLCLGPIEGSADARAHVCLALACMRGMYQTEDRDDRAFTFYVQQDCDDEALMLGACATAFRGLPQTPPWRMGGVTNTMLQVMKTLESHTPYFSHVLAHPPHALPDGADLCGHVLLLLVRGFTNTGKMIDPFIVEPTSPTVPFDTLVLPEALSMGVCRVMTRKDYRRLYFLVGLDSVRYCFGQDGPDKQYRDGIDVNLNILGGGVRYQTVVATVDPATTTGTRAEVLIAQALRQKLDLATAIHVAEIVATPIDRPAAPAKPNPVAGDAPPVYTEVGPHAPPQGEPPAAQPERTSV